MKLMLKDVSYNLNNDDDVQIHSKLFNRAHHILNYNFVSTINTNVQTP